MKKKLSRIHSPWRRQAVTTLISIVILIGKLMPRRARVHWVGSRQRRARLERPLFIFMFLSGTVILEPHDFAYWAVLSGGATSIFLVLVTIYRLLPYKHNHWIE